MKPNRFLTTAIVVSLAMTIALAGDARTSVSQTATAPLTEQAISNAAYPLDVAPGGAVQLKDGQFDDAQSRVNVTLVGPQANGDLNGDGAPDAIVTLAVNTGGSGVFSYIAAVLNEGGNAKPVDSAVLGDRIRMRSIAIARNGEITANYLDRRFDQPMVARPTIPVTRRFKLSGDKLIASQPLANADLNNATYPLQGAKDGQVTFASGRFRDDANQVSAQLLPTPRASGDLNGDGAPDSAVIMVANTGGSGVFSFVCAVLNDKYQAKPADCVLFGDRVQATGLAISDGKVTLDFLDRKPDEPMATKPSVPTTFVYVLQDGKLTAAPGEVQSAAYTCADGKTVAATFGKNAAIVEFAGETQVLSQAEAADGFRYANTVWELRGKGNEATLTDVKTGNALAGNCMAQPQATAPAAPTPSPTTMMTPTGVLTGVVTYLQRIALSPSAVITVQLQDVSRQDVAATVLASQTIETQGKQVPIPFELKYDPAGIDSRMTYAVSARITEGGKLTWISTTRNSVLTRGFPATDVTILVQQVTGQAAAAPAAAEAPELAAPLAGSYQSDVLPAADASGRIITLTLSTSEQAAMTTQFIGKGDPIIDGGTWTQDGDKAIVSLEMTSGSSQTLTFQAQGNQLVLLDPVEAGYGTAGLTLTRVAGDATGLALPGVLTGTVTYLQRIALPDDALVEVQLADVSKQDVAATVIASQTIATNGAQVPIPFDLKYDPAGIDPRMTYAVSVRITSADKLIWISTTHNPVLTRGAPMTGVEIVVDPVGDSGAAQAKTVTYACAAGKAVTVTYGADSAEVTFDGKTRTLPQVVSGSGIRYDDGVWEWRSKGPNGFLVDVDSHVVVANECREQATGSTSAQAGNQAVITGTVTYRQRIALPDNAIVQVQLADVSKQDVAATVIASQTIETKGKQVPIPFEIVYDPTKIDPRMILAVSVRITSGGKLIWISTRRNTVLTNGAPMTGVEIQVEQVR